MSACRRTAGFTLMELLTVTAIIATLAGIITPVVIVARHRAFEASCTTNLRSLWLAMDLYCDPGRGWLDCPTHLAAIEPYASNKQVFLCPADIRSRDQAFYPEVMAPPDRHGSPVVPFQISYYYIRHHTPAGYHQAWPALLRVHPSLALLACPWHGHAISYPHTASESFPYFDGKILHARLDGSICRSQGWAQPTDGAVTLWSYLHLFRPDDTPGGCR